MEITQQEIELWFHYEEIAMHFNQLIMQYRLQLMGGAGAIGAISSYLIGGKIENVAKRHELRVIISFGMLTLVCAAAVLDLAYYHQLLQGAVKALLEFEAARSELNMSTLIHREIGDRGVSIILCVYLSFIIPLFCFTLYSWNVWRKDGKAEEG